MAEEKKTKDRGKKIFKIFIIISVIYTVLRIIPNTISKGARTITLKEQDHSNQLVAEAVIIRDEKVYKANSSGELERYIEDGERVAAGTKIATLLSSKEGSAIENELKQIDLSIKELREAKDSIVNMLNVSDKGIEGIINQIEWEIQYAVKEQRLEDVNLLKERLKTIENLDPDSIEDSNKSIEELEKRRDELAATLDRSINDYYTEAGGVVSFAFDGEEENYRPFDFEKYSYDYIKIKDKNKEASSALESKKEFIESGEKIFKTMDNFSWYLAIKIDDINSINDIIEARILNIKINDEEPIYGSVVDVNTHKNKGVIIVKFTEDFHKFYNKRFVDVAVVKSNASGYKIPKEAVTKKDGEVGVYIKDLRGIVRFRPIISLGEDGNSVYAKPGDENGYIRIGKETILTVTPFDEVFLNPKSVREGKIMD